MTLSQYNKRELWLFVSVFFIEQPVTLTSRYLKWHNWFPDAGDISFRPSWCSCRGRFPLADFVAWPLRATNQKPAWVRDPYTFLPRLRRGPVRRIHFIGCPAISRSLLPNGVIYVAPKQLTWELVCFLSAMKIIRFLQRESELEHIESAYVTFALI